MAHLELGVSRGGYRRLEFRKRLAFPALVEIGVVFPSVVVRPPLSPLLVRRHSQLLQMGR